MIKTYDRYEEGRVKVFFVVENGEVQRVKIGNQAVSIERGIQFYIDEYIAKQINKCELIIDGFEPKLRVKEGETLFIPKENDEYYKQKEIEELEKRLKELKGDEDGYN